MDGDIACLWIKVCSFIVQNNTTRLWEEEEWNISDCPAEKKNRWSILLVFQHVELRCSLWSGAQTSSSVS